MRKVSLAELQTEPAYKGYLDWVPEWTQESLFMCFQFTALELEPYEFFYSDGAACLMISGEGKAGERKLAKDSTFGFRNVNGKAEMTPEVCKVSETSVILCFNTNIFQNVCFGMGCGSMHTRVREMLLACAEKSGEK